MSDLSVRRAEKNDLDAVAGVWHESAAKMDGAVADLPSRAALRQRIDAELACGWDLHIALRDGCVIGMLVLKPELAILDQIFVSPGEQGRCVGRTLLDVAKHLMPAGFTLRIDAANDKARRLYVGEGMTKLSEGIHPWTARPVHFYGWNVC